MDNNKFCGTIIFMILLFASLCAHPTFKLGIENIDDAIWLYLHNKKPAVGIITNQTGTDQQGTHSIDLLLQRGVMLKRIFAPEHGLHGTVHAENEVLDAVHGGTNIPVVSLYGKGTGKKLDAHTISDLDLLIFDIQDSGMRHYTYISTLLHCMKAAAAHNKAFIVLDRPNPLGARTEGPISDKHSTSFIAAAPIALRHGMTIGELARYFNNHILEKKVRLHVVKLQNYVRSAGLPGNLLAPLSPNIISKQACFGYSFLGLLGEVRPFDIGLGTDKAMRCLALPERIPFAQNQWKQLQLQLKTFNVDSKPHRYFSARKKQNYRGLLFDIQDINAAGSFDVVLTILKFFHDAKIGLEFADVFDVAIGTSKVQDYIKGKISRKDLMSEINADLVQFYNQTQGSYLYHPFPHLPSV